MIALYRLNKTSIGFWYRRRLNTRSLIQPSEILSIELTETHIYKSLLYKEDGFY